MRKTMLLTICMAIIFCTLAPSSWGQEKALISEEGPVGIFASRDEYHNFTGELKSIDDPQVREMVPFINDMALEKPIGFTNQQHNLNPQGTVDLLSDRHIREELERQIAELREQAQKKLLSKVNRKQRDQLEEMIGDEFDFGSKKPAKGGK